jgi:hypothetical protein
MFIQYKALENININDDYLEELTRNKTVNIKIIGYRIIESQYIPFLSFCLTKNRHENNLYFPTFIYYPGNNINCLIDFFIAKLLEGFFESTAIYKYKGCFEYKNDIYVVLDLTQNINKCALQCKMDKTWFVLPDELINTHHVCNISIDKEVTNFFLNNTFFLYLHELLGDEFNILETPTVVYSGTHEKNIYFQFLFGKIKTNKDAIFGNHYYFTDYINAVREGGWSKDYKQEYKYNKLITENNGKYIKGGIIRYAIFLGNCLYKENFPLDETDKSNIKQLLLNTDDNKSEKDTLRITDYDSLWETNYDSVYLGNIDMNVKNTPIYVVKDYKQQSSLSYHFIDKWYLGETFDENQHYSIK